MLLLILFVKGINKKDAPKAGDGNFFNINIIHNKFHLIKKMPLKQGTETQVAVDNAYCLGIKKMPLKQGTETIR